MPNLLQFVPAALSQAGSQLVYAEVTTPAPQSFTDTLFLFEPDWSVEFALAHDAWPACHGMTLPLPGDQALIVVDSRGNRRCVWWDGQMTFATQTSQAYYLTTTASDLAGHTQVTSAPFSPKTAVPFTSLVSGATLLDYATPPGVPGRTFLPAGQFEFHVHALQAAGNETVSIYAQVWEYDPTGGATIPPGNDPGHVAMIGQSQVSLPLTSAEVEYRLFFSRDETYAFYSAQSRLVVHVHVLVGGSGGASVTYYVGGAADSHVVVPVGNPTVSPSAWIPATYQNSWGTAAACTPAAYLKDSNGIVRLRGRITGGASGTAAFTLPPGFRSGDVNTTYPAAGWNGATAGAAFVDLTSSNPGLVYVYYAAGFTDVGLGSITFLAEG